jgi:hypothetical protein
MIWVIYIAILVVVFIGFWKMFEKANKPGWAGIVPIYNYVVLLEIIGRPIWWIILMFIPIVSLVIWILIALDLAKSYGKSAGFGVGIIFLPFIFIPILGFGDAQYRGPAVTA